MSSIGVIGGADGPTRVFVSGPVWPWAVFGAAAVALVVFLIVRKKMNRAVHLCGRCRAMEAVI